MECKPDWGVDQMIKEAQDLPLMELDSAPPFGLARLALRAEHFTRTVDLSRRDTIYVLQDDVEFQPTDVPAGKPFHLGWFAAVRMYGENIILDLNGKYIRQSVDHWIKQRFFAIVEVGSVPFLQGQGPSDMGGHKKGVNIAVLNGLLGRSSHHGIHGVGNENVVVRNVSIANFEVAGIHLNSTHGILIMSCSVGPSLHTVPVNSLYAQAVFLLPHLAKINQTLNLAGEAIKSSEIYESLKKAVDDATQAVIDGQPLTGEAVLFHNASGLPEGSVYGIVCNGPSLAVRGFGESAGRSTCIVCENVTVIDLESQSVNVTGAALQNCDVCNVYGGTGIAIQTSTVGSVFRIIRDESGAFVPDMLSKAQLLLAQAGIGKISEQVVAWCKGGPFKGIQIVSGIDTMGHILKGNIGLFLQKMSNIIIRSVSVANVSNASLDAFKDSSYLLNAGVPQFQGSTSRGVCVVDCEDLSISQTDVNGVYCQEADVYGIDFIGKQSQPVAVRHVTCRGKAPLATGEGCPEALYFPIRVREPMDVDVTMCPCTIIRR